MPGFSSQCTPSYIHTHAPSFSLILPTNRRSNEMWTLQYPRGRILLRHYVVGTRYATKTILQDPEFVFRQAINPTKGCASTSCTRSAPWSQEYYRSSMASRPWYATKFCTHRSSIETALKQTKNILFIQAREWTPVHLFFFFFGKEPDLHVPLSRRHVFWSIYSFLASQLATSYYPRTSVLFCHYFNYIFIFGVILPRNALDSSHYL